MTKRGLIKIVLVLTLVLALAACSTVDTPLGSNYNTAVVVISFNSGSGANNNEIAPQTINAGDKAIRPFPNPVRDSFTFNAWMKGEHVFDFNTPLTENTILTASWTPIQTPDNQSNTPNSETNDVGKNDDSNQPNTPNSETNDVEKVESITLNHIIYSLIENQTVQLIATIYTMGNVSTTIVWSTSNRDIVRLSGTSGSTITAIAMSVGTATITATSTVNSNISASVLITVSPTHQISYALRSVAEETPTTTQTVLNSDNQSVSIELPRIIEYFAYEDNNFFLMDLGFVRHSFVSEIFPATRHLGPGFGVSISMYETRTDTTTISNSITNSAIRNVTTSRQTGGTMTISSSIEASTGARLPFLSPSLTITSGLAISTNYESTRTTSDSNTWSTNMEEAMSVGNTDSFGVSIGANSPAGFFRAAMYSSMRVMVELITSSDNQMLVGFRTVGVATSFTRQVEFSTTGAFDNSPTNTISMTNIDENFLLALPIPTPSASIINFDVMAGGNAVQPITSYRNTIIQLPIPTHTSNLYSFVGWENSNGSLVDNNFQVQASITLRARWLRREGFMAVSAGGAHSLAVDVYGRLWAWGRNNRGQIGNGSTVDSRIPIRIAHGIRFTYVSAGEYHSLAIDTEGSLWAWGWNNHGTLGDGTTTNRYAPKQIGGATRFTDISAGFEHSMAICTDGRLWTFGRNNHGQLGDGTTTNRHTPRHIGGAQRFKQISASGWGFSLAISADGRLWAWGLNTNSRLGDGTTIRRLNPVHIGGDTRFIQVSAGYDHSLAICLDGRLFTWGSNTFGRLGNATDSTNANRPTLIAASLRFIQVAAGRNHSVAIGNDNRLFTWGGQEELGHAPQTGNRNIPIHVGGTMRVEQISAGRYHTISITTSGSTYSFGNGSHGRLGNNSINLVGTPTRIG